MQSSHFFILLEGSQSCFSVRPSVCLQVLLLSDEPPQHFASPTSGSGPAGRRRNLLQPSRHLAERERAVLIPGPVRHWRRCNSPAEEDLRAPSRRGVTLNVSISALITETDRKTQSIMSRTLGTGVIQPPEVKEGRLHVRIGRVKQLKKCFLPCSLAECFCSRTSV